ncbi:cytosolic carboxypeptidase 1-like isoform X2 [Cephus cinctus]|uniref:Cytosolic carboxypeptidase 1-like isoform X2 n=1 Tax=Cephus cinctus TaxID=211228 RepID=A0AAJ7RNF6_CEPCN|nr:cytosolic carboxypeptidase 1-like isoform X2 [Cephus cinctus]
MADAIVQDVLWVLGQIAQKDHKFAMKVKLLNSTKLFHYLLKQYYNHDNALQSLLMIIKNLANNSSSVQALVKDGIVATFEKTLVYLGHTPHLKLKILLECFKQFTVSRLCCTKFVKVGLVHLLMQTFEKWEKFDGQLTLKIYNCTLNILQHLCHIRSGRKTIKSNDGLQLLYTFCTNCPEDKSYDRLLFRVCGIINQCLEKKELPVPEMSPAS